MLNPADTAFHDRLQQALPQDVLRPMEDRYLTEPRDHFKGQKGLLALPRSVEEVATLIRVAGEERVGVVPYGGGTGLVGGQVLPDGPAPLILSLERMNAIRNVFTDENVLVAEAGAILADVQNAAAEADRLFPLSLAAEGSARIGGNLATNAGGTAVLRYGNARELCLGIEAVLPSGAIWRGLSRLRKDNTGYDLRDLIIGSEGTLGVITAAALKLFSRPKARATAFLAVESPAAALKLLALVRGEVGEMVSGFELIHCQSFEFLKEKMPQLRRPFGDTSPEWSILVEVGLSGGLDPDAVFETVFDRAHGAGLVSDGVLAQNEAQADQFWEVRESIPEANRMVGAISSHDISLPLGAVAAFISMAKDRIAALGDFRHNCFGHLGDGNLHYNVYPPEGRSRDELRHMHENIQRTLHDLTHELGGTFSAEHGVGRLKTEDLERYKDPTALAAMRTIKDALDPVGIMNPGAVLRAAK